MPAILVEHMNGKYALQVACTRVSFFVSFSSGADPLR